MRTLKGSLIQPFFILAFTIFVIFISIQRRQFLHFDTVALTIQNIVCFLLLGLCFLLFFYQYKHLTFDSKNLILTFPLNPFINTKIIDLSKAKKYKLYGHRAGYTVKFYLEEDGVEIKKSINFDLSNKSFDTFVEILKELKIKDNG